MERFSLKTVLIVSVFLLSGITNAQKKVAFIVGNSDYPPNSFGFQELPACVNDADAMSSCLSSLGFRTYVYKDCDLKDLRGVLETIKREVKNADVSVFFYSGHASRCGNEMFLVPAKTSLDKNLLKNDLMSVDDIERRVLYGSKLSFFIFDACRDGAFDFMRPKTKGADPYFVDLNGLVDLSNEDNIPNGAPRGWAVCYATEAGQTAAAGNGKLSPFTHAFIEGLKVNAEFRDIWEKVIKHDALLSDYKMNPIMEDGYSGKFNFNPIGLALSHPFDDNDTNNIKSNKKLISMLCNVPEAKVEINGVQFDVNKPMLYDIGTTYRYTVSAQGYESQVGKMYVTQTSNSSIQINLKKESATEFLVSSNREAEVYLDNTFVGYTTNSLHQGFSLAVKTTTGSHVVNLSAKGCETVRRSVVLTGSHTNEHFNLYKHISKYWRWDGDCEGSRHLSYHFSPKYQIGLNYLWRPEDSHVSYGIYLAASTGIFKGLSWGVTTSSFSFVDVGRTYTVDENGTIVRYQETTTVDSDKPVDKYSEDIDPDHEAKKYDANALCLANFGYSPCNGLLIEAGIGAGFHIDRYHLPYTPYRTKTVTTNLNTGVEVGEPTYGCIKGDGDKWLKGNRKWSPAFRLGAKALIPLDGWDQYYLTLGGGYAFQFTNMKQSSWDATIGFCWTF